MAGVSTDPTHTTPTGTASVPEGDDPPRTGRRALIMGMAVGVGGLVAEGLLKAEPAGASTDPVLLGQANASSMLTEVSNTNDSTPTAAVQCDDVGGGIGPALVAMLTNVDNASPAIQASSAGSGPAIEASTATAGAAVQATTTGSSPAIVALTNAAAPATALEVGDGGVGKGSGIVVDLSYTPNDATALLVNTAGGGYAIYAKCTLSTNSMAVIAAFHEGLGPAMELNIDNIANVQPVITATTNGSGPAIAVGNGAGGLGGGMTATISGELNYSPPLTAVTSGRGPAVRATVDNPESGGPAFEGSVTGVGPAMRAETSGTGSALLGEITNTKSASPAVSGITAGKGHGVAGATAGATAAGVAGTGSHGATGVSGESDFGVGVRAVSKAGAALEVNGKVTFSRSGVATVPSHAKSVKVELDGVSKDSMVLATIQQLSGAVGVANVVPESSSFVINLSDAVPQALRVAWMVLD